MRTSPIEKFGVHKLIFLEMFSKNIMLHTLGFLNFKQINFIDGVKIDFFFLSRRLFIIFSETKKIFSLNL